MSAKTQHTEQSMNLDNRCKTSMSGTGNKVAARDYTMTSNRGNSMKNNQPHVRKQWLHSLKTTVRSFTDPEQLAHHKQKLRRIECVTAFKKKRIQLLCQNHQYWHPNKEQSPWSIPVALQEKTEITHIRINKLQRANDDAATMHLKLCTPKTQGFTPMQSPILHLN